MAKKIILFLIIVSMTQNSKSQNLNILDAKFSPLSNIIALTVGDDKNSNLRLYFSEKNELTGNIFRDSLNRTTVGEFEFSPDGDKIALLLTTNTFITDLFLYDIKKAELTRCTNSVGLKNIDFAYKSWLNWCDNQSVIFVSKHTGLAQQYIYNFTNNTFVPNGSSTGNEYLLSYSRKNQESYYIAIINNREPSIFRRKLGSSVNSEISKDGSNHDRFLLSSNENYLFYSIMDASPCMYDLNESKFIKTKLPKSYVSIINCAEKDTNIVYSYFPNASDESFPKTDLYQYNYLTQKKRLISKGFSSVSSSPDGSKFLYTKISKLTSTDPTQMSYKFEDIQIFLPDNNGIVSNLSDYGFAKDWSSDNKTVVFANKNKLVILNTETHYKKLIQIEN